MTVNTKPQFPQPEDENMPIWRYLDYTKFVDLLSTSELHFSRADRFNDPFEGSYPIPNVKTRKMAFIAGTKLPEAAADEYVSIREHLARETRQRVAINCWHMNEHESAAMWKLYLMSTEGVAVRATYASLRDCLAESERVFSLGQVTYIDYRKDMISEHNTLIPFFHKHKGLDHERELRAMTNIGDAVREGEGWRLESPECFRLKVDVARLVDAIVVSPYANDWFGELVKSTVARFGVDIRVEDSVMKDEAVF